MSAKPPASFIADRLKTTLTLLRVCIERGKLISAGGTTDAAASHKWFAETGVVAAYELKNNKTFKEVASRFSVDTSSVDPTYMAARIQRDVVVLESLLPNLEKQLQDALHDSSCARVASVLNRFSRVARQLGSSRHAKRIPFTVDDEYDVQYLLHGLLLTEFDDVRREEWSPSHAGSQSRMDFVLKQPRIVIETKMVRVGLLDREVSEQLTIDKSQYKAHPDCRTLFCFIYDPERLLQNPEALQDLKETSPGMSVHVFVRPRM